MVERDDKESKNEVRRMFLFCSELERVANVVLGKAGREKQGREKKKQPEHEGHKAQVSGSVLAELEEATILEQSQAEMQAPYRGPLQSATLCAGFPQPGRITARGPTSQSSSQAGSTHASGGRQYAQMQRIGQANWQARSGQWNPTPFAMPLGGSTPNLGQASRSVSTNSPAGDFTQTTLPGEFYTSSVANIFPGFDMPNLHLSRTSNAANGNTTSFG